MTMSEAERLFFMIAIFNTAVGMHNFEGNEKENKNQTRIEKKIDRVLELLERGVDGD